MQIAAANACDKRLADSLAGLAAAAGKAHVVGAAVVLGVGASKPVVSDALQGNCGGGS